MKNVIAALLALSTVTSVAFAAPPESATGTFTGTVGGKCVVKTNITDPQTLEARTNADYDSDGFVKTISGEGNFTFRSNSGCNPTATAALTSTSETDGQESCIISSGANLTSAQTSNTPAAVTVKAQVTDATEILVAGTYGVVCTVTLAASTTR